MKKENGIYSGSNKGLLPFNPTGGKYSKGHKWDNNTKMYRRKL
jgi:hypothetical protein